MPVLYLPLIGFFAGMLIISLGGGGGAVYVGVLTGLCGIAPDVAASVSLATAIPTTLMGAFSHYRAGNVNIRLALYVLAGTAVGSVAGSLCSGLLPLRFYNMLTGLILLILALQMTWHCIYPPKREIKDADSLTAKDKLKAMAYGLLGGVMSGLLGVTGGGPITAGLFVLGCTPLHAVGTSVFVIFGMSMVGFFMHLSLGHMDWNLVKLLLSGTLAGAFAGPWLMSKLDRRKVNRYLRPLVAVINLILAVLILMK